MDVVCFQTCSDRKQTEEDQYYSGMAGSGMKLALYARRRSRKEPRQSIP